MAGKKPRQGKKEKVVMGKKRYCYSFEEGDGTNKKLLGGKGAGCAP